MTIQDIASAVGRVKTLLERRPAIGMHEDLPATARWQSGLRVHVDQADGSPLVTDLPSELGGSGDQITPGWLFRAGLASCLAASIALDAAAEGIELSALEVVAGSRSDVRGLLGMSDDSGTPVSAGPQTVQLRVRIAAPGCSGERLLRLVENSNRCSPVSSALRDAIAVAVTTEVGAA
jgi:uncharacterized OsmC-like protein